MKNKQKITTRAKFTTKENSEAVKTIKLIQSGHLPSIEKTKTGLDTVNYG